LCQGGNTNEVVDFTYPLGAGLVYYSTIPIDYYLDGYGSGTFQVNATTIYMPNLMAYILSLTGRLVTAPPTIAMQPQSQTVTNGNQASFTVTALGSPPLFYQWQKNGTNLTDGGDISGSKTNTLNFSATTTYDIGNYTVVITNAYGSVTSSVAVLTVAVIAPPVLTVSLSSGTIVTTSASGRFAPASSPVVGNQPQSVAVADVNGDGPVDLVSANEGSGTLTVLTNTAVLVTVPFKNVVLSWSTNAAGFVLQQNSNLATANWQDVTNTPSVTNGQYQVTIPVSPANNFFHLFHP
jgi:hypothetical protein